MKKKIIIISSIVLGIVLLCLISLFLLTKATPIEDGSLEWVKNTKISHRGLHFYLTLSFFLNYNHERQQLCYL